MKLTTIRRRIDRIDNRILRLLEQRMRLALKTGERKSSIPDSRREGEVWQNLQRHCGDLIRRSFLTRWFRLIIEESRWLQQRYRSGQKPAGGGNPPEMQKGDRR